MKRFLPAFSAALMLTAAAATSNAQDIHFSQFYENASLRNPALTGIFSGDYKAGVNYNKSLEDEHGTFLSLGFAGAFMQRSLDPSKMTFDNQYVNGSYNSGNGNGENLSFTSMRNFDLSAGLSLNSSFGENNNVNYYIGAAAYHITKPKQAFNGAESFIRLNTKWTGQLGVKWNASEQLGVTMHMNYANQNPYQEWIGGGMLSWRYLDMNDASKSFTIYGGMFYRLNDAFIPTVKFDYQAYSITMSYDMNNSSLRAATQGVGGWEMSLFVRGKLRRDVDRMKCPRFELNMPAFEQQ